MREIKVLGESDPSGLLQVHKTADRAAGFFFLAKIQNAEALGDTPPNAQGEWDVRHSYR